MNKQLSADELKDLVIESDTGARNPRNRIIFRLILCMAFLWSAFQVVVASDWYLEVVAWFNSTTMSEYIDITALNSDKVRSIHLAFAVFLAFLCYPAFKSSPRRHIPILDWVLALAGAFAAAYYWLFYEGLSARSGIPTTMDKAMFVVGILCLLEATRRALGPPLLIIATIFLLYAFFGNASFIPDLLQHKGQSLSKVAGHMWLSTEGVFGIALGVSADFVFLFVLFGALLDKAGAGNYFIKLAFSMLGHLKGGPAKAAVLSSGMTGLISGSSIANTVTTGTFTVPLMKRVGFSGEKAGAVEVASSVNGQIMPPVMGAAAFLMVEYASIPYIEVIKHAFIPALISYIALIYMVHLEAVKSNMPTLPKAKTHPLLISLRNAGITISGIIILAMGVYYGLGWLKPVLGEHSAPVFALLVLSVYVFLVWYSTSVPELEQDDPNAKMVSLPETAPTAVAGVYFLLPIVVLVWFLMIERLSPALSAYWATLAMIFILLTQHALKRFFRKVGDIKTGLKEGWDDFTDGMIAGAKNMIGIGVATAAAGVIVGVVSLTGVGQVLALVIEALAGGSIVLILILTALICLILGMGLPTTANYIVVASLMAHVVLELGLQNGLVVPLIAVHLFVFYFGIMADVTPPVGLASFAAAAISGADPLKTGGQAFAYSLRTAILPFFFIFNTELILIGVDSYWYGFLVFLYAMAAILLFSAAVQGYFVARNKWYESLLLLTASVTLFVPQLPLNYIFPKYAAGDHLQLSETAGSFPEGSTIRIKGEGENAIGEPQKFTKFISTEGHASVKEALDAYGLTLRTEGNKAIVDDIGFNSPAENDGMDFEFAITSLEVPQAQPHPKWLFIPAFLLVAVVYVLQRRRRAGTNTESTASNEAAQTA